MMFTGTASGVVPTVRFLVPTSFTRIVSPSIGAHHRAQYLQVSLYYVSGPRLVAPRTLPYRRRLQFYGRWRWSRDSIKAVAQRTPRMPCLMFCVRSRHPAGTSTMESDWAVALPASAQDIAEPQRLFHRDHDPPASSFASCRIRNPLSDFALVDVLSGHRGRRLPLAAAGGNRSSHRV
jgi:hypothetical protein